MKYIRLFEEVKDLFKFKIDPNKIYYHFSDNLFTKFIDQKDINYERKHSLTNRGIYFHESPPKYKYGKNKYEVLLDIKNPFIINNKTYISDEVNPLTNKRIEIEHINDLDIEYLKSKGYDSVVAGYPAFQTVIFDPEQATILKINNIKI